MNGWNQKRARLWLRLVIAVQRMVSALLSQWFSKGRSGANKRHLALCRYGSSDNPYLTAAFCTVDVSEQSASGPARGCARSTPNSQGLTGGLAPEATTS